MCDHLEELKKKFIVDQKLDEKRIVNYTERILPFCKISKDGLVIVEAKGITSLQQVQLALVARFLANYLDNGIPAEISNDDLSISLNLPKDQVAARLKELRDAKFATLVKRGVHQVNALKIEGFVKELESASKKRRETTT